MTFFGAMNHLNVAINNFRFGFGFGLGRVEFVSDGRETKIDFFFNGGGNGTK